MGSAPADEDERPAVASKQVGHKIGPDVVIVARYAGQEGGKRKTASSGQTVEKAMDDVRA